MNLTFYGGAKSVSGANYFLESGGVRLIVDCGLHQGSRYAEHENFDPFPYDPKSIDAVLVTHAHIDHTGRLPKLYRDGFRGTVFSTPPTRAFAEFLLFDSGGLLEKEAAHDGHAPLYNAEDVKGALDLWHSRHYHEPFTVGPFRVEFYDAGHILGSAIVVVEAEGKRVVFSGDLGNYPAPIIKPTEFLDRADYCLVESAYGDRVHEDVDKRREHLEDAIEDAVQSGGALLIPAFAMERTQEILYHLNELAEHGRIPRVPTFIDSPLAIKLTHVYEKYENYFNKEAQNLVRSGDDILNFPGLRFTLTTTQSREIADVPPPKVILAGSGMSQGGRIIHHEKLYLPDPKSMILFVGYQAANSPGRLILDGVREVTVYGEKVPVRCKVRSIHGYSAHADQPRLFAWVAAMRSSLKKAFVVQGEEQASAALASKIRDELAVDAVVPEPNEKVVL